MESNYRGCHVVLERDYPRFLHKAEVASHWIEEGFRKGIILKLVQKIREGIKEIDSKEILEMDRPISELA